MKSLFMKGNGKRQMRPSVWGALLTAGVAAIALAGASMMRSTAIGSEPWVKMRWLSPEIQLNVPSISDLDGVRFLAANFNSVLEVDTVANTIRDIGIHAADVQPAGIHYDKKSGTLFTANYLHNNVTAYRRSGDDWVRVAKFDGLTSPEGVWFDSENSVLAVAEFDGHRATLLDVKMGDAPTATKRWSREVGYAHGITVMDGRVYVSGLLDRQIVEFDLDGRKISATGHVGWRPEDNGMLWPTSVLPDGRGNLIVSDAESGYVWIFNPKTKKFVSKIGGAGPGRSNFVQPYVSGVVGDRLVVASTKAQRFLLLSYPGMSAEKSMAQDESLWQAMPIGRVLLGDGDWDGYSWVGGPVVSLLGKEFTILSSGLVAKDGLGGSVRIGYDVPTIGNVSYVKQLVSHKAQGAQFLFSPYSAQAVALKEDRGRLYNMWFTIPQDCWPLDGKIECASSPDLDTSGPLGNLNAVIEAASKRACPDGHLTYADYISAISLATSRPESEIEEKVEKVFDPVATKTPDIDSKAILSMVKAQVGCEVNPKAQQMIKDVISYKSRPVVTIDQLSILSLFAANWAVNDKTQ